MFGKLPLPRRFFTISNR